MKYYMFTLLVSLVMGSSGYAYEGPSPLQKIRMQAEISSDSGSKFTYRYSISNPSINNGSIYSINLFLGQDFELDSNPPSHGFSHCPSYYKTTSANALKARSMTEVGSAAPPNWDCTYSILRGFSEGAYSWGAADDSYLIDPGSTKAGFLLVSYGLPAIRDVLIKPAIQVDQLPNEYEGNLEKTLALENKVRWLGKTVGPKAPPKKFSPGDFINYLISIKEQSFSFGWIKNQGIATSLDAKLNNVKKKIAAGDNKTAKNVLGAFQNEVQAQNGKQLSTEAYALLYFNAKYLIDHL